MKKVLKNLCVITAILVVLTISGCSDIREYEITVVDDKNLSEYTGGFFSSSAEFKTDNAEFYRYYIDGASKSNETFIRLTYSTYEQYSERLSAFLDKGKRKKSTCPFNEKYVQYYALPAPIVSGGKQYLAEYCISGVDGEMIVTHLMYDVLATSDEYLTIVFYKGYIVDNVVFKHKPKYFLFFGFEPNEEGDYLVEE